MDVEAEHSREGLAAHSSTPCLLHRLSHALLHASLARSRNKQTKVLVKYSILQPALSIPLAGKQTALTLQVPRRAFGSNLGLLLAKCQASNISGPKKMALASLQCTCTRGMHMEQPV